MTSVCWFEAECQYLILAYYASINFYAQIAQNLTKFDFEVTDFQALEAYRRVYDGFLTIGHNLEHLQNTPRIQNHTNNYHH